MNLIWRRLLSSLINGTIIFLLLTSISIIAAFVLWFVALRSTLDMKWFYLLFAATYSLFGSLSTRLLPKLGGFLARIQLREVEPNKRKVIRIIFRLLLFYLVPLILLSVSTFPFIRIGSGDIKMTVLLFTPLLFCVLFTAFVIPVSIIIGNGYQGLHDAISGLAVCKIGGEIGNLLPFRKLAVRSLIVTSAVSFFFLIAILYSLSVFKFQNVIFNAASEQEIDAPLVKEFDSLIPITPLKWRSYDLSGGFKWWVDLSPDARTQIRVNRAIGLKGLNAVDLLGYGFSVRTLSEPISVVHMDRVNTRTIPAGSEVLSVYFFVDTGAFYYFEVRNQIHNYFAPLLASYFNHHRIDATRIKTIRLVKAGYVELGFFDEFYLGHDTGMWRDKDMLGLPVICNIDSRIAPKGRLITSADLE